MSRESGRAAKTAGDAWESWIEAQHTMAMHLGILAHEVEHNKPEARVVGGRLIYTAPGISDYSGVLTRGAVCLAVEAKSTQDDYLARAKITPQQQRYLYAVGVAGGVSLLLVEFRRKGAPPSRYACPWALVPWQVKRSAESVVWEDLLQWEIRLDGACYLERFHARGLAVEGAIQKRVYPRE